jgi:Flp pilus assembly protein CpaB
MLNLRPTPRRWVVAGALRSLEAAQGRYTAVPLWAGEQVLLAHLGPPDDPAALPNGLSPAERGAVVSVEAGTAKAVRPGDCVDVVAVTPSGDGLSQVSRLVPGVRVLKVSGREEAVGGLDPWVMLAVSPSQAQTLALAEETGKVRLVLRGGPDPSRPSDREGLASERRPARTPATGLAGEQRPGGTRPQVTVVEVIRGVEREAQAGPEALLRH